MLFYDDNKDMKTEYVINYKIDFFGESNSKHIIYNKMVLLAVGLAILGTCVYSVIMGGILDTYIRRKQQYPM